MTIKKSELLAEIEVLTDAMQALEKRVAELEARPVIQLPKVPDENRPYVWPAPTCPVWPPEYPIITWCKTYAANTSGSK
jgi:hypothetical protein